MAHSRKLQAVLEKEKGNAAYKQKELSCALEHYDRAIELDPINITFYNNKAAVFFEQGQYNACIEICEKAVEIGRENRADFKLIAKSLVRIGNASFAKGDLKNALDSFNKALAEHRTPDMIKKVHEVEEKLKELERLQYVNPDISLEEKEKGNAYFKAGDFPNAMKHYKEAIKRNPDDPKIYSNRAGCYAKLMEFNLALADSEMCIKLDPNFTKGYLRKGSCFLAMKKPTEAAKAFSKAMEIDPDCTEAIDGYRKCVTDDSPESVRERALHDPEIQAIISDPAMQMILDQLTKDPKALKEFIEKMHGVCAGASVADVQCPLCSMSVTYDGAVLLWQW